MLKHNKDQREKRRKWKVDGRDTDKINDFDVDSGGSESVAI